MLTRVSEKYCKPYIPQPFEKIMRMLLLNYKYFFLQDLHFHISSTVSLRNTLMGIFMHFL